MELKIKVVPNNFPYDSYTHVLCISVCLDMVITLTSALLNLIITPATLHNFPY